MMNYEKAIVIAETKIVADEFNKLSEDDVLNMRAYVNFLTGGDDYGDNASDKEFPDLVVEVMKGIDDLDELKLIRDIIMENYFNLRRNANESL